MRNTKFVLIIGLLIVTCVGQNIILRNPGCNFFDENGACISCSTRFYKDRNNICQPVSANCKTYDQTSGKCLSCYPGFGLLEGTCLPGLVQSTIMDPYCNTFQDNICVKCSFGYYFNIQGKCTKADPNCQTFNQKNGDCTSCYAGFVLKNGKCNREVKNNTDLNCNEYDGNGNCIKCSSGYYFVQGKCTKIDDSCKQFNITLGRCVACYSGYSLNAQSQCVRQTNQTNSNPLCAKWEGIICISCAQGSYFNNHGICTQADVNCKTFNSANGACTSCYAGFTLKNGFCTKQSTPILSDPNCNQFDSTNKCIKCSSGFYFNDYQICTKIDDNCKSFSVIQRRCFECYAGYQLNNNNQCVKAAQQVTDPNCAEWNGQVCVRCSFGAVFNNQKKCVIVDPQCKEFNSATGICKACYVGYQLNKLNVCVRSSTQNTTDSFCAEWHENICVRCAQGTYFNSNGICTLIDPSCKTANQINGQCTSCYAGYELNATKKCVRSQNQADSNPQCAQWLNQICLKCAPGTYFNTKGICQTANPLCRTFNPTTGYCTSCYPGYNISGSTCVISTQDKRDPFCKKYEGQICVECADRYFRNNGGLCQEINVFCKEYNKTNGVCLTCYGGFVLSFGQCVQDRNQTGNSLCAEWHDTICVKCSFGSFFNNKGICQLADPQCARFNQYTGSCQQCYPGYKLSNNSCIIDKSNTVSDPFCAEFSGNICLRCSQGYYFEKDGKCTAIDPLCATYNKTNGRCLSCYTGYQLRSGLCVKKDNTQVDKNCAQFLNGICIKCSQGFYFNQNGVCTIVNPLCKTYNQNNGVCTSCYAGYKVQKATCVVDSSVVSSDPLCAEFIDGICLRCAERAYFDFYGKCQKVNENCRTYNEFDGSCTSCYPGFGLFKGQCSKGQLQNGCSEVDSNNNCIRCANGYYLDNRQCVQIDPQCAQFNLNTKKCTGCYSGYTLLAGKCQVSKVNQQFEVKNCVGYNSNNKCIQCFDRYYLTNNKCTEVSVFCKNYDQYTGACTSCYSTFTLIKGQCKQV